MMQQQSYFLELKIKVTFIKNTTILLKKSMDKALLMQVKQYKA